MNVSSSLSNRFGIREIATFLPEERVPVQWLADEGHVSPDNAEVLNADGCLFYHRATHNSPEDLACAAIRSLLSKSRIAAEHVDFIVYASTVFETTALYPDLVARRIGQEVGCINAKSYAVQHAYCVSPFLALKILCGQLELVRRQPSFGILVCSDSMGTSVEHLRAISTGGVHSDGATAMLITSENPRYRIVDFEVYIDGSRYQGQAADGSIEADFRYFIFLTKTINRLLTRNNLQDRSRVHLCTSNLDPKAWTRIAKVLNIHCEKVHMDNTAGHIFGSDPFINLTAVPEREADYCILAAAGVAGSYAAMLLGVF